MAQITKKNNKRHRIQFTMSLELHERYTSYQLLAKDLGLVINFNQDFEDWFKNQLDQIGHRFQLEQVFSEPAHESELSTGDSYDLGQDPDYQSSDAS